MLTACALGIAGLYMTWIRGSIAVLEIYLRAQDLPGALRRVATAGRAYREPI